MPNTLSQQYEAKQLRIGRSEMSVMFPLSFSLTAESESNFSVVKRLQLLLFKSVFISCQNVFVMLLKWSVYAL